MQDVVGFIFGLMVLAVITSLTWWAIPSATPKGLARLRVLATQQTVRNRIRRWATNEALDSDFVAAGLSWMTAAKWYVLRLGFTAIGLLLGVYQYETTSRLGWLVLPYIVWMLTRTQAPSLLRYSLRYRQAQRQYVINRDLYTFYILLIQDLELQNQDQAKNLYQTFQRLQYFLPQLKRPLKELILHWSDSPEQAIQRFGAQIRTKEALYLAQVLLDVQRSTPGTALDILHNRFAGFQTDRIAEKQKLRKARHTVIYFALMTCTVLVGLNGMMIVSQYITTIIASPYNHAGPMGP